MGDSIPASGADLAAREISELLVNGASIPAAGDIAAIIRRRMGEGIDSAYEDVKAFQIAFGNPIGKRPSTLTGHEKERRIEWMREEIEELAVADTVVEQADAIIDLLYFAFGYLVEMGVPPSGAWNAVHAANMAKLWPDGVHTNAVGKVVKPHGWHGPEQAIGRYVEILEEKGA